MSDKIKIESPEGVCYSCTQCGDCCREWNIMLGPGEAERMDSFDWSAAPEKPSSTPVTISARESSGRKRLVRLDSGACVFLSQENRCLIHEHFGEEAKPLVCRLFPFSFYPMGDRTGVDVSFFCRSISENSGEPLEARTPEWQKLLESARITARPDEQSLDGKRNVSGTLLWELEFYLISFLKNTSLSFFDRIRCCSRYLELATTGDPEKPSASILRKAIAEGLPSQMQKSPAEGSMNKTQHAFIYQELFLALNPVPPNLDLLDGNAANEIQKRRLKQGEAFRDLEGHPLIENKRLQTSFREIDLIGNGVFDTGDADEILERYFAARIIGQRFRFAGEEELPLYEALQRLLLTYPFIIWTSKALAAERKAAGPEAEDVRKALRLVDRSIGQTPMHRFNREQREAVSMILLESDIIVSAVNDLLDRK